MDVATVGRIGFVMFFGTLIAVYGKKLLQHNTVAGRSAIIKFVLCGVLMNVQTLTKALHLLDDAPLLIHIFANTAQHYGLMFGYMATDQALNNKEYRPILRSKSFLLITVLSVIVVILEIAEGDIPSFSDNEAQNITLLYYGANLIHYLILLGTGIVITSMYYNSREKHQRLDFMVIRIATISSFVIIIAGIVSVITNLTISFAVGYTYSTTLNTMYHISKLGFGMILIVQAFTRPLIVRLIKMNNQRSTMITQKNNQLLKYLHSRITAITPTVVLEDDDKDIDSIMIEISDADEIISSHRMDQVPVTAQQQAKHLFELLQAGKMIQTPGDQLPPARRNLVKHYIRVAQYLEELESRHEGRTRHI